MKEESKVQHATVFAIPRDEWREEADAAPLCGVERDIYCPFCQALLSSQSDPGV